MTVVKKVWNIVTSIMVTVVVAFALMLVLVRVAGVEVYTVISGSMEPQYHVGSLIYVQDVDTNEIEAGDVITFNLSGGVPATHRVVRIDAENQLFYTKGDSNEIEDRAPVAFSDVIGTPVFTIPYLGYAVTFIQSPAGIYTAVAAAAAMLLISIIPSLFTEKEKQKAKAAKAAEHR